MFKFVSFFIFLTILMGSSCKVPQANGVKTTIYSGVIRNTESDHYTFEVSDIKEIMLLDSIFDYGAEKTGGGTRINVLAGIDLVRSLENGQILCYNISYSDHEMAYITIYSNCNSGFVLRNARNKDLAIYFNSLFAKLNIEVEN